MEKKIIKSDKAPKAIGPYSQAIQIGNFLYTSGQIGINPETGKVVDGGIEAETHQVFKNLKVVLEEAGFTFRDVVKVTAFLSDLKNFALFNKIYEQYLGDIKPARSTVEVSALPLGCSVEIEMVAIKGE